MTPSCINLSRVSYPPRGEKWANLREKNCGVSADLSLALFHQGINDEARMMQVSQLDVK